MPIKFCCRKIKAELWEQELAYTVGGIVELGGIVLEVLEKSEETVGFL